MVVALAVVASARPAAGSRDDVERTLHAASVLVGTGCSGVLAEGPDLVLTAKHCIEERQSVDLRFADGATRTGWVAAVDHVADQALIVLEEPVAVEPLTLARRPAIAGSVLYFEGRPSEARFQEAKLDHVGTCPSLPRLQDALFTTIAGVPGDSGAPIVDAGGHVVGLVHGGAQCQIATPAETLLRLVERFLGNDKLELPVRGN